MRNNKAKLAFEMLEMEMEVIESGELINFKGGGGEGPITWSPGGWVTAALSQATVKPVTSGIDAEGNWVIKIGDAAPIPLTYSLEEVTITPVGKIQYVHEDVDSWLDIFNLPPETNNYEQNPGFSGIILPQENPWGLPTFEEFYANINPAVFNGAGNSDTEGYDYLTGYNSAGYNSMGYNSAGVNIYGLDSSFNQVQGIQPNYLDLFLGLGEAGLGVYTAIQTGGLSSVSSYYMIIDGLARAGFSLDGDRGPSNIGAAIGSLYGPDGQKWGELSNNGLTAVVSGGAFQSAWEAWGALSAGDYILGSYLTVEAMATEWNVAKLIYDEIISR